MIEQSLVDTPARRPPDPVVESNHRIANHLGLLVAILHGEIASMREGPEVVFREEAVSVLQAAIGKVMAISRLHHLFTAHPSQAVLDLGDVMRDILEAFEASVFSDRLHTHTTFGTGCQIRSSHVSAIALSFAEIATNAMKYAHPSGLPVELSIVTRSMPGGGAVLEIGDDGVGLPEGFEESRDAGVGLKLVRSLVESADGRLKIKSNALGLTFTIQFPPMIGLVDRMQTSCGG